MKKLKNYLHLYLGCEISLSGKRIKLDAECLNHTEYFDRYSVTKLILRKPCDISCDELKQLAAWSGTCSPNDWEIVANDTTTVKHKRCDATFHVTDSGDCVAKNSDEWKDFSVSAQQGTMFKQMLDWGFDLFNLIHSGLAIDKASLKNVEILNVQPKNEQMCG